MWDLPGYVGYIITVVFLVFVVGLVLIILKVKYSKMVAHVAKIKARDPGFKEDAFLSAASSRFLEIQQAWMNRDMEPVRAYLTEAMLASYNNSLQKYIAKHTYPRYEELSLTKNDMFSARSGPDYDSIDVWFSFKAKYYTADAQGKVVSGSASKVGEWDQRWSFIRPVGATSQDGDSNSTHWLLKGISNLSFSDNDFTSVPSD